MRRKFFSLVLLFGICLSGRLWAQDLTVDCSTITGTFRPLHGVNGGPLCAGETVDLTPLWKDAAIPSARLHDCEWPAPVVVDIHSVFPDFRDDARAAENYRFKPTDDYLAPILESGAKIVYRLGESIEHTRTKHFVHPPPDPRKWAEICLHIVKHYNDGWNEGYHHGIEYWEIWNEPENRPQMWTGTDDQFLDLYAVTAKTLKESYPDLKIGGPAVGGGFVRQGDDWTLSPFVVRFLDEVRQNNVPLDFFSWHTYTDRPLEYVDKAISLRKELDRRGFENAEIHLNEWNYLPDGDWASMLSQEDVKKRENWFRRLGGSEGAAFVASVLIELQDAPVDVANYFNGGINSFGLFNEYGAPKKTFYAFLAFRRLLDTPERIAVEGNRPNVRSLAAGRNSEKNAVSILIANLKDSEPSPTLTVDALPWTGPTLCEIFLLDETHDFEKVRSEEISADCSTITIDALPGKSPSVVGIRLSPENNPAKTRRKHAVSF